MEARTKKEFIELFREKLRTDVHWAVAGLKRIYQYQESEEIAEKETKLHNGVGFTSCDAEFLTSLGTRVIRNQSLSAKQVNALMQTMPKYATQLFNYSVSVGTVAKVEGLWKTVKR